MPEMVEQVVRIVNAFSNDDACALQCSASTTVLQIKRSIEEMQGTNHFCQSIFVHAQSSALECSTVLSDIISTVAETQRAGHLELRL